MELRFASEREDKIRENARNGIHSSGQVACTYIGQYHVTTIYRESSAMTGGWYYETFVWSGSRDERELEHQSERGHVATCQKIIEHGDFWNREEEE